MDPRQEGVQERTVPTIAAATVTTVAADAMMRSMTTPETGRCGAVPDFRRFMPRLTLRMQEAPLEDELALVSLQQLNAAADLVSAIGAVWADESAATNRVNAADRNVTRDSGTRHGGHCRNSVS